MILYSNNKNILLSILNTLYNSCKIHCVLTKSTNKVNNDLTLSSENENQNN